MSFFESFLNRHPAYLNVETFLINFNKSMTVAQYANCYIIETETIDEEGITTCEVLSSRNKKTAVLISRERTGENHSDMRTYPRDNQFPIGSIVRLVK
jgi:hypothetical protein